MYGYTTHFSGLDTRDEIKNLLESEVDHLLDAAPSDSSARATIIKVGRSYVGEMHICSTEREFSVQAGGSNLTDLSCSMVNDLWAQIKKWRAERFGISETDSLDDIGWMEAA